MDRFDTKKRYLIFAGYDYYPGGGMSDAKLTTNHLKDGLKEAAQHHCYDWFQIFDLITGETINLDAQMTQLMT